MKTFEQAAREAAEGIYDEANEFNLARNQGKVPPHKVVVKIITKHYEPLAELQTKLVELAKWCERNDGDIHTVRELVDWDGLNELLTNPLVAAAIKGESEEK